MSKNNEISLAVIAGATGLVGSLLLERLLNDPEVKAVVSIGRRSTGVKNPKLREILLEDLTRIHELTDTFKDASFFCCLGTTIKKAGSQEKFRKVDFDAVVGFGKLAEREGARSFAVVSAAGASSDSMIFYNRVKGEAEDALRSLGLSSLIILRPSLLIGERSEKRPAEQVAIRAYKMMERILPKAIAARLGTPADRVAGMMLKTSKAPPLGTEILGPERI